MREARRRLACVAREFHLIARRRALRFPAEAAHAARHIGLEPDTRLLAVVADVDPGLDLRGNHSGGAGFDVAGKLGRIDGLPGFLADQNIAQRRTAWQASDMSRQDPVGAGEHAQVLPVTEAQFGTPWNTSLRMARPLRARGKPL